MVDGIDLVLFYDPFDVVPDHDVDKFLRAGTTAFITLDAVNSGDDIVGTVPVSEKCCELRTQLAD
jgi:hypothetical protein